MDIIIYRTRKLDLIKAYSKIYKLFVEKGFNIRHADMERCDFIDVENKYISFFCHDYRRMGGIRPTYYNTDNEVASRFLSQGASKVDGREVASLEELCELIWH